MIEVTCSACGTLNRIAEGDVSPGTKFVTCASCKSRVALPGAKATTASIPKVPPLPGAPIPKIPSVIPPIGAKRQAAIDLADLPAPKRTSPLAMVDPPAKAPPPRSPLAGLDAELPAPKASAKSNASAPLDLDDLMPADLPAPKQKTGPAPKVSLDSDLPAPKPKFAPPKGNKLDDDILDLPAPKDIADLPAPKAGIVDLPTPKAPAGIVDLPTPKAPAGIVDLPTPKAPAGIVDLPTPKAGIVDLPMPKAGITDLPAPKGFTDLPAPKPGANNDLPAPKGFFDDLPQPSKQKGGIDLPAPKGFFDDLPQPATQQNKPDLPAPKGFFDDLPQPASANKPEVPAPKGFFDDLPQPAKQKGVFDDLPEPKRELSSSDLFTPPAGTELDLGDSLSGNKPLELSDSAGALDLGGFKDLDLAEPVRPEPKAEGPIKFKKPTGAPATPIAPAAVPAPKKDGPLELALADEPHQEQKKQQTKLVPKVGKADLEAAKAAKQKKTRAILAGVLGVALVGSGGVFFWQRHAAAQHKADEIASQLATARSALTATSPNHWQKAATAAKAVVEIDGHNAAAYGLGAEALIAGALDTGQMSTPRIQQGRQMIAKAQEAGITGPELDRAQALAAIAAGQSERAVTKLRALTAATPKDGFLQLYLGWALLDAGDAASAIKAFDAAVASAPATKLAALYGHGRAKLAMADLDGARADFTAVLEANKDHVGAQVGLAAALPPEKASQREADLLAILARKDIGSADPRAVVEAWTLAADVARDGNRLDVARDRYSKALAIQANAPAALTGLAMVELRDGKITVAEDLVTKAQAVAADRPEVQLVAAEVWIKTGKLPDALAQVKKLEAHQPPLPPLQQAHLMVVKGRLLEAQGQDEDAIDAFMSGAKLAGDLDLSPTMAAVEKLSQLAKKATDAHDDKKAAAYEDRADRALSSYAERASDDPQLALTLGAAYLQAGNAAKAETLLQRAVEMRGNDIDAHLQLGKALSKLGRIDESIAQLEAALKLDPTRVDIRLDVARTFETAGKDPEASAAYDKLLADPAAPLIARVYAGKFWARQGVTHHDPDEIKKAAALANAILLEDGTSAAGHYLKGEGLLAAGKTDEARVELTSATSAEDDVQYLDALGRTAEASFRATNDSKFQELAIQSYTRATEADPTWFNPWAGLGRAHVQRHEFTKSIEELDRAYKIKPDAEVAFDFGLAYKAIGPKQTARQWLEKSVELDPKRAETWFRLGEVYQDSNQPGDDRKMIDAFEKATRLGLEEEAKGAQLDWLTEAFYTLGDQYMLVHNLSGAKHAWQQYIGRHPKDQTRYKTAYEALATTLKSVP
jgi:tetratricopeptide (TPR) repeat protein